MRIFNELNEIGNDCPICKTKKAGKTILAGIAGTEKDGIIQAMQVHIDCIELVIDAVGDYQVLYMKIEN